MIPHNELRMEVGPWNGESEVSFYSVENIENEEHGSMSDVMKENSEVEEQSQYIILGIIIAAGIGAAIFYLKGYKPKR